jgi:hypothetical protein
MSTNINRRRLLGQSAILAPLLGLGVLGTTAQAGEPAAADAKLGSLLGTWSVRITFPANPALPEEFGLFAFTADRICFGTTTRALNLSLGSWKHTPPGFEYSFRQFTYTKDDVLTGSVRVQQAGTFMSADSWTAQGTGTAYNLEGQPVAVLRSASAGTRY